MKSLVPQVKAGECLEAIGNDQLRVTIQNSKTDTISIKAIFRNGSAMMGTASLSGLESGETVHKIHFEAGSPQAAELFKDVGDTFRRHKRNPESILALT